MEGRDDRTAVAVKSVLCAVVADLAYCLTCDCLKIGISVCGDLTHNDDETRGAAYLTSNAGHRVLRKKIVKDGIRDHIADLIGMALGNRLGCKKSTFLFHNFSFLKKETSFRRGLKNSSVRI